MIDLSKRMMDALRRTIGIAPGVKAAFPVTPIAGPAGLWPAIFADAGATALVAIHAPRLFSPVRTA
jgi:cation transport ATPase